MIYIINNEKLEDKVANLQKIEDEAGSQKQELAPPSKNTDEQAKTKDLTCVSGWGTVTAGIYRWRPLVPVG
jgi:hypothetical protein